MSLHDNKTKFLTRAESPLSIVLATPLGLDGRGGIDRLNDSIFENIAARSELNIAAYRLVTRGQRGLFAAQFIFARALMSLFFASLRGKVDILHIHLSNWGSSYRKTTLGAVARVLGIPYVVHLHGSAFDEFWSEAPKHLATAVDRFFLGSEQIVVLGQYWARSITDRIPEVSERITVLPNATKSCIRPHVPAPDARVRITCLGQLGERKGTPQLVDALNKLASRSDWIATIAGDGMVRETQARLVELGLESRIIIPGWLDADEADELLSRTDILVLPSLAENLPMVILEAFAHGVPVISTPIGAIPEVVHPGQNGLLVPVDDVSSLAAAIKQLIDDSDLRFRLGNTAKQNHAENYEIGAYVSRLSGIWRELVLKRETTGDR